MKSKPSGASDIGAFMGILIVFFLGAALMSMAPCMCANPSAEHTITIEIDGYEVPDELPPDYASGCSTSFSSVQNGGTVQVYFSYIGGGCPLQEWYINGVSQEVPDAPTYYEGVWLFYSSVAVGPITEDILIQAVFTGCG